MSCFGAALASAVGDFALAVLSAHERRENVAREKGSSQSRLLSGLHHPSNAMFAIPSYVVDGTSECLGDETQCRTQRGVHVAPTSSRRMRSDTHFALRGGTKISFEEGNQVIRRDRQRAAHTKKLHVIGNSGLGPGAGDPFFNGFSSEQ